MDIQVREAKKKEWNKVVSIYKKEGLSDELELVQKDAEKEFSEIGTTRIIWFAEKDHEMIGVIQLVLASDQTDLADGKTTAMVHHVRVYEPFQRSGVGSRLYKELEVEALDEGITRLTIEVEKNNRLAQSIYEHWGFTYLRDGVKPNEIVLFKNLK